MRVRVLRVSSLNNTDEYVGGFCSSIGDRHIVMVIYWDNSIMYFTGNKCSIMLREILSRLKDRGAVAKIIVLKQSMHNTSTYIIEKMVKIDFLAQDSVVREYSPEEHVGYYIDERVKVIR